MFDAFQFRFAFISNSEIDWKVTYIGSTTNNKFDQILDSFSIGPLDVGVMQFMISVELIVIKANAPDPQKIPTIADLLGSTAIFISVEFKGKEFFRVGYYVNNEFMNPEFNENPPSNIDVSQIQRSILIEKPVVTTHDIEWEKIFQNNFSISIPKMQSDNSYISNLPNPFNDSIGVFDYLAQMNDENANNNLPNYNGNEFLKISGNPFACSN